MPINYPSESLANKFISESFQDLLQIYGTLVIDGTGSVVFDTSNIGASSSHALTADYATAAGTATSSSYAVSASWAPGGVTLPTGLVSSSVQVDVRNTTGIETIATTGSNTFIGTQTVTGSLKSSGSNELLGNTILSGTLHIQGQYPVSAGSTSVQIMGNTHTDGFIQFEPVVTQINSSISASYIYVSASGIPDTYSDLYFTQVSNGTKSDVRLRWLTQQLYTGLLKGGTIISESATTYKISSGSGIFININATGKNSPLPVITYINWQDLHGNINTYSASYDMHHVGIDVNGAIVTQVNPYTQLQSDLIIPMGMISHLNHTSIDHVSTIPHVAYMAPYRTKTFMDAFGPLKMSGFTIIPSSSRGLQVGAGTAFVDGGNYHNDANKPSYLSDNGTSVSKIYRVRQSGSEWVYDTNGGAGYTTIDPTQYSLNGTLTAVPGGGSNRQWSIQRVYYFPTDTVKEIIVYYGNTTYLTQLDAIANVDIELFTESPHTANYAVFLGSLVVRNNADFTVADSQKIVQAGLFRNIGGSGGGGGVISNTLDGLADVTIVSPTEGQALVYDTGTSQWVNSGSLTANLIGSSSYSTTSSLASNINVIVAGIYIAGTSPIVSPPNGI